ncbi:MAG: helix-turn-helix transcriptional regulator [Planctomycetota bacterium]|nr:helix-turn-helix transcriptional regulator [Planctomycetota bacterium]
MHALKEIRIRRGLGLIQMADLIGWSKETLRQVENGQKVVTDRLVGKLAEALKLTIDDARRLASGEHVAALGGASHGHDRSGVRDTPGVPAPSAGHVAG